MLHGEPDTWRSRSGLTYGRFVRRPLGATDDERSSPVVGDHLVADAQLISTRAVTIDAPPSKVFPWLLQMGFRRAGWYSWDLIDNLGRRSATAIEPAWQTVDSGDVVPGGLIDFEAAIVDPPHGFVLVLRGRGRLARRISFSLAYDLREVNEGTRLVTRVRGRIDAPLGGIVARHVLGPGDGVMLRRQLVNIARRAEAVA